MSNGSIKIILIWKCNKYNNIIRSTLYMDIIYELHTRMGTLNWYNMYNE
jgi:hypothetical protein